MLEKLKYIKMGNMSKRFLEKIKLKYLKNQKLIFYYDETGNFRKLSLSSDKDNGFNQELSSSFVLGGIVLETEITEHKVQKLMSCIKVNNPPPKEIKSKHIIGKGNDYSKHINSENLNILLKWLIENKISIHYTSYCTGYSICKTIIDTIVTSNDIGEKTFLLKIFFEKVLEDQRGVAEILENFKYPFFEANNAEAFWNKLIVWLNFNEFYKKFDNVNYTKNINTLLININISMMKKLDNYLRVAAENKEIIKDTHESAKGGIILRDLLPYYELPTILLKKSQHIFDHETEIEKIILNNPLYRKNKNYKFVDSEYEAITVCDWIVGILGKTFEFLRHTNESKMVEFVQKLNKRQRENLILLGNLIKESGEKNPYFIRTYDEFAQSGKLEWITNFEEFEFRAKLNVRK